MGAPVRCRRERDWSLSHRRLRVRRKSVVEVNRDAPWIVPWQSNGVISDPVGCPLWVAAQQASRARTSKDNTIMVRRYFDHFGQLQSARRHRFDGFLWCHPQLCLRASWFAKYGRFLTRTVMPIDYCKLAVWFQCRSDSFRKSSAIWNA